MITGCYMTAEQVAARIDGFMYVRDGDRKPIGLVVWTPDGKIGWSLYNEDHEDEIFSDKGLLIALVRAETIADPENDLCQRIQKALEYRSLVSRLRKVINVIRHIKDQAKKEMVRQSDGGFVLMKNTQDKSYQGG